MGKTQIHSRQIRQLATEQEVINLFASGIIPASVLKTSATDTELDYLHGVTSAIQTQINAKLASSAMMKEANAVWTDDAKTVTAKAIAGKIASEIASAGIGHSVFKGALSTATAPVQQGWSYVVDANNTVQNNFPNLATLLENGDYLIAKEDLTAQTIDDPDKWVIVQTNIQGAVTTVGNALTSGALVVGAGASSVKIYSGSAGLLKVGTGGVLSIAGASDLPSHKHDRKLKVGSTDNIALTTDDKLTFASSGGGSLAYDSSTKTITITFPTVPNLSVSGGGAENGKYVSAVAVSGHAITVTKASLPALPAEASTVYKTNIVPSGTKNGTNKAFTLAENIVATTLQVYLNGQLLVQGTDYTVSGTGNKTITFANDSNIPLASDTLTCSYIKA